MCAELHKAIADSLKQNNQHLEDGETKENARSVQLRSKRKRNEGFYAEFDESQDSSITTDFTYTESTQNTESQSDMELCDSDNEYRTNEGKRICFLENYVENNKIKVQGSVPPSIIYVFHFSESALALLCYVV